MPSDPPSRSPALPAWYHRLLDKKDTVKPKDFDEDLSEIENDISSDDENCSHDGSEYDYYYDLKVQREDRKEELKKQAKQGVENQKKEAMRHEQQMSSRVKAVVNKIKKQEKKSLSQGEDMFVRDKLFSLYSADFVEHGFTGESMDDLPRNVQFYHYTDVIYGPMDVSFRRPWWEDGELEGQVTIDGVDHHFEFPEFIRRGGLKKLNVKTSKGEKLVFQFLDSDHLILRTSRKLAFANPRPGESAAPKTLVFYGIAEGEATGAPGMWFEDIYDYDDDDEYGY